MPPRRAPAEQPSLRERIYAVVRRIPRGRVSSYGRVAALAGLPRQARLVGYALSALPEATRVPWHRVVNAAGAISLRRGEGGGSVTQRLRLEREGVRFDARGRIDLERFGWPATPPAGAGRTPLALWGGTGGAKRPRRSPAEGAPPPSPRRRSTTGSR